MSQVRGYPPFQVSPKVHYSGCETDLEEIKLAFVWAINKFSLFPQTTGECLRSSLFSASDSDTYTYYLILYPRGDEQANEDYVSLFFQQQSGTLRTTSELQFSVLINQRHTAKEKAYVKKNTTGFMLKRHGWPRYIRRDYLMSEENGLLKNDELTICCEIVTLSPKSKASGCYNSAFVESARSNRLADDLGNLLNSKNYCDVVLVAEDKELHAHKNLLCARSPVFNAMFQHDMEENRNNRVVISDIGFNVLEELVRFIYTGKLPDVDDEMLMKLLYAADKYCIEDLTAMCDQALAVKLNAENLKQLIPLASLYNTSHLKVRLVEFMKYNTCTMNDAGFWKLMIKPTT